MSWILSAFADEAGPSTREQIAALQEAGVNHIDLRGVDGYNISVLPVANAKEIQKQLAAAGVKVNMFGSPLGKIDIADDFGTELEKLRHLAQLAPIFSCRQVRIFSYYNKQNAAPAEFEKAALDRLSQLKKLAQQLDLVLFHENERHIFGEKCGDVLKIAQLRDAGQGGHFKLIFDFDNYNQCDDDVWQNWLALRDVTDAFHLKDSDEKNQHVPLGQGAGRAREILADARQRNWSGCLSLEPHLAHSAAVMATGPSGQANQQFAQLGPAGCFQVAAKTAQQLLSEIGATVR